MNNIVIEFKGVLIDVNKLEEKEDFVVSAINVTSLI